MCVHACFLKGIVFSVFLGNAVIGELKCWKTHCIELNIPLSIYQTVVGMDGHSIFQNAPMKKKFNHDTSWVW